MDLNIKFIKSDEKIAFYSVEEHPELIGVCPFTDGLFCAIWSRLQLKSTTVINTVTKDIYKLKQKNFLSKILGIFTLWVFTSPIKAPFYFYINNVNYGKFKTPIAIVDDKEHVFEYKKDKYEFSFHEPNVVAVLLNGKQTMKFQIKDVKNGGDYLVKYDPALVNDVMLIFMLVVCIDNIIFPIDWFTYRCFGPYKREEYPERAKWIPSDENEK